MSADDFEVVEVLAEFPGFRDSQRYRVSVVSWHGHGEKLDFRLWYRKDGGWMPGKGFSVPMEDGERIRDALNNYFGEAATTGIDWGFDG